MAIVNYGSSARLFNSNACGYLEFLGFGFALLAGGAFLLKKIDARFWIGFNAMGLFFVVMAVSLLLQFYFANQGEQLYKKGFYEQALRQHQKVYGDRYLQFGYNMKAGYSQLDAAKCYCQLGNFEEARKLYLLAAERYSQKAQRKIAEDLLRDLNEGLEAVANYNPGTSDAEWKALELAGIYQYKLFCDKKALEIYRKVMETTASERIKESARKYIEELKQTDTSSDEQ
jgi:tetratricopeptide (TPR) repeat protein